MKRLTTVLAYGMALAVLVGATRSGRADVVFNNFGFADGYNFTSGWVIGLDTAQTFWEPGDAFTVSGDFVLTQITLAASYVSGPNEITVWLMDDASGVPGQVLEQFDFSDLGQFGDFNPPLVAASVLNPILENGNQYWLVASTSDSTTAAWNRNSTGDIGLHAFRKDGGNWTTDIHVHGAFRIEGEPID
jgi:hypothetical protein